MYRLFNIETSFHKSFIFKYDLVIMRHDEEIEHKAY